MENALYFISTALFLLKIFNFLSWFLGHVTAWLERLGLSQILWGHSLANKQSNTHIAQYLEK